MSHNLLLFTLLALSAPATAHEPCDCDPQNSQSDTTTPTKPCGCLGSAAPSGATRAKVIKMSSRLEIEGPLSREATTKVVTANLSQIHRCYERQILNNPDIHGNITFKWIVLKSGAVTDAKILSSTMAKPAVAECVLDHIEDWTFPAPDGDKVVIQYPFMFRLAE